MTLSSQRRLAMSSLKTPVPLFRPVRLRAKVSDPYDARYHGRPAAEGWTVEAADILLLDHSERGLVAILAGPR